MRSQLKLKLYGTERPSKEVRLRRAEEAARRVAANLGLLEASFQTVSGRYFAMSGCGSFTSPVVSSKCEAGITDGARCE